MISHLPHHRASPSKLQLIPWQSGRGRQEKTPKAFSIPRSAKYKGLDPIWAATAGFILDSQEKLAVAVYVGFPSEGNKPKPSS